MRRLREVPSRVWSDDEWQRLQLGYQARSMDEKWNVFAEGQTLFCHRSWTDLKYFEATFTPVEGGGWRISSAKVKRAKSDLWKRLRPSRRRLADAFNLVLLELVLSAIVLGEPATQLRAKLDDVVRRQNPASEAPPGLAQHVFLGQRSE